MMMNWLGGGCPPQLTSVDEPSYSGQVSGGCPPQLTNTDETSHSGQAGGVSHNRKIMKRSAAQVIQDYPELCSVANVGTLAALSNCCKRQS